MTKPELDINAWGGSRNRNVRGRRVRTTGSGGAGGTLHSCGDGIGEELSGRPSEFEDSGSAFSLDGQGFPCLRSKLLAKPQHSGTRRGQDFYGSEISVCLLGCVGKWPWTYS